MSETSEEELSFGDSEDGVSEVLKKEDAQLHIDGADTVRRLDADSVTGPGTVPVVGALLDGGSLPAPIAAERSAVAVKLVVAQEHAPSAPVPSVSRRASLPTGARRDSVDRPLRTSGSGSSSGLNRRSSFRETPHPGEPVSAGNSPSNGRRKSLAVPETGAVPRTPRSARRSTGNAETFGQLQRRRFSTASANG